MARTPPDVAEARESLERIVREISSFTR